MAEANDTVKLNDEDKKALIAAAEKKLDELVNARLSRLFDTIRSSITTVEAEQQEPKLSQHHYPPFWVLMPLPLLLTISIYWRLLREWPVVLNTERLEPLHYQMAILAFVVALAAYLANVSRDIIKALSDMKVSEKTLVIRNKHHKNLAWVSAVEIHLVILGVLASLRLVMGKHWAELTGYSPGCLDNFLLIYLAMIIASLGALHVRQWCLHTPFKANVTIG